MCTAYITIQKHCSSESVSFAFCLLCRDDFLILRWFHEYNWLQPITICFGFDYFNMAAQRRFHSLNFEWIFYGNKLIINGNETAELNMCLFIHKVVCYFLFIPLTQLYTVTNEICLIVVTGNAEHQFISYSLCPGPRV